MSPRGLNISMDGPKLWISVLRTQGPGWDTERGSQISQHLSDYPTCSSNSPASGRGEWRQWILGALNSGKYVISLIRLLKAGAVSRPENRRMELRHRCIDSVFLIWRYKIPESFFFVFFFFTFILAMKNMRSLKYILDGGPETPCFKFWRECSHMESWSFIYVRKILIC